MAPGLEPKAIQERAPVVTELLTSALETLRRDGELVLYTQPRPRSSGGQMGAKASRDPVT
jgi:hypothetical protein